MNQKNTRLFENISWEEWLVILFYMSGVGVAISIIIMYLIYWLT